MPVYHFTLHAYATWMPDREQGSFHYRRGYQARNEPLAEAYRIKQAEPPAAFPRPVQETIITAFRETCPFKHLRLHAVATDATHVHAICSWADDRDCELVRERLKQALSMCLNRDHGRRTWLTRGGDCKRVRDEGHLRHLMNSYLPSHGGARWDERTTTDRTSVPPGRGLSEADST